MPKKGQQSISRSQRFLKLASMTASVATGYAKSRVKGVFQSKDARSRSIEKRHATAGQTIAKTLGELKGAAMKIGQMASLSADLLPKEISSALTVLQKEAPPMPYEVIAAQIERELGAAPELLFDYFDPKPFASASIGQVHRARTDDGREVVVKIQYPGIDKSVDSDVAHLKMAIRASGLVRGRGKAFKALFQEIRARLHEELDYTNEAENVRVFQRIHADDEFVVIPEVVGERSAQRVLTLTFEDGHNLNDLDSVGFSQEERNLLGIHLFKAFGKQIFQAHTVHADPNPANFAFRKNGQIVFYDFGCVSSLTDALIRDYRDTIRASLNGDYKALDEGLIKLDTRVPKMNPPPDEFYQKWHSCIKLN